MLSVHVTSVFGKLCLTGFVRTSAMLLETQVHICCHCTEVSNCIQPPHQTSSLRLPLGWLNAVANLSAVATDVNLGLKKAAFVVQFAEGNEAAKDTVMEQGKGPGGGEGPGGGSGDRARGQDPGWGWQ